MTDAPERIKPPTKVMIEEIVAMADAYRKAHGLKAYAELSGRAVGNKGYMRKLLASRHPPSGTIKSIAMLEQFLLHVPMEPGEKHDRFVARWRAKHFPGKKHSTSERSDSVSD